MVIRYWSTYFARLSLIIIYLVIDNRFRFLETDYLYLKLVIMEKIKDKKVQTVALAVYCVVAIIFFLKIVFFDDKFSYFWFANATISSGLFIRIFSKSELKDKKRIFKTFLIYFFSAVVVSVLLFVYKTKISHTYTYIFIVNLILACVFIYNTFFNSKLQN